MNVIKNRFGNLRNKTNKDNAKDCNIEIEKISSNVESDCSKWKFSPIDRIEESMFNKVLEKFYNLGIRGLTRENIQNSLDGKLHGIELPVIVTIKTGKVNKDEIPGLNEIKDRIKCLQGHNSYTKETIEHMNNKMNNNEIFYISFEDSNTKGLKGANNGQSDSKEDTWSIYAYNKGVHAEDEDGSFEKSRGGSHGIGKIASNAASDLFMMYFANCDEEGNRHLGGTVQLLEHKYNDKYYRSTGYFTDLRKYSNNECKFYPYKNDFHEIFSKETRGLKIIIPFLRDQFNNEKEIIRSICDSFFIAIIQKRLEVVVNNKIIDNKTIKGYILNKEYYVQDIAEMKEDFTPLYFETFMNQKPFSINIQDSENSYNFKLYFNYNEVIPKGRVAIIRSIGMKIEDKKVKGNANKPFNAVLMPESTIEDEFLKSLENESHTELTYEHIKDQKLQKSAKRFINNISKELSKVLEEEIKKNNPTDGIMNTKDILYLVENQFKQELSNAMSTVKINKGNKNITVVKIPTEITKKREPKEEEKNKDKDKKKKKSLKEVKVRSRDQAMNEDKQTRYFANPDIVARVVIGDKEFLRLDLSDNTEIKKAKLCDISLSVVDGMGVEYSNEFNMKENYKRATDKSTGIQCKIKNNLIKNVVISKGVVQIELELEERFNKALKFVYYIEV